MKVVRPAYSEFAQSSSNLPARSPQTPELVFGGTPAMQDVKRKLQTAAETDLPVLLHGECGTGKDLCAQYIHHASRRSGNALVKVNCPAIPASLLDTELFGYDKGAFIGAKQAKEGRVEQAHRGTLVLDEVNSLDSFSQSKLLQVLQDGTFTRAGGREMHSVSTRVVSLVNTSLRQKVQDGGFRMDLLYRLNSVTIDLPPLRERLEDLSQLIACFTIRHTVAFQIQRPPLTNRILQPMSEYHWPGNLHELDNLIRSYILLGDEQIIASELALGVAGNSGRPYAEVDIKRPFSLKRLTKKATKELERQVIMKVLQANGWNRQRTAKWLQISYRSLLYKLNEVEQMQGYIQDTPVGRIPGPPSHQPVHTTSNDYPLQVQ